MRVSSLSSMTAPTKTRIHFCVVYILLQKIQVTRDMVRINWPDRDWALKTSVCWKTRWRCEYFG